MATLANFLETTAFGALNNFLGLFNSDGGHALPSRYEVVINPPPNLISNGKRDNIKVSLNCHSVAMPGRTLTGFTDDNMYGIGPYIVDGISFGEGIAMSFYASSDLWERVFFEAWQEIAWNRETWNVGYYEDYAKKASMDIYILDKQDTRRFGIRCHECYPLVIGPTQLDYVGAPDIIKIPVTMQYKYWDTLNINNQPPSLFEKIFDTAISGAERSINANIPESVRRLF